MKIYSVRGNLARGKYTLGGLLIELKVPKCALKGACATWMSARKRVVNPTWASDEVVP